MDLDFFCKGYKGKTQSWCKRCSNERNQTQRRLKKQLVVIQTTESEKQCVSCGQVFPQETHFVWFSKGLSNKCKPCLGRPILEENEQKCSSCKQPKIKDDLTKRKKSVDCHKKRFTQRKCIECLVFKDLNEHQFPKQGNGFRQMCRVCSDLTFVERPDIERLCTKCKQVKQLDQICSSGGKKTNKCKKCFAENMREYNKRRKQNNV